jgi:hypothetical protein
MPGEMIGQSPTVVIRRGERSSNQSSPSHDLNDFFKLIGIRFTRKSYRAAPCRKRTPCVTAVVCLTQLVIIGRVKCIAERSLDRAS